MAVGSEDMVEVTEELATGLNPGGGGTRHGAIYRKSLLGRGDSKGKGTEERASCENLNKSLIVTDFEVCNIKWRNEGSF